MPKRVPLTPIAPPCSVWPHQGQRCKAKSEVWILAPDGEPNPGGYLCRPHGEAIVKEYQDKLGETWTLEPLVFPCVHRQDPRDCKQCP